MLCSLAVAGLLSTRMSCARRLMLGVAYDYLIYVVVTLLRWLRSGTLLIRDRLVVTRTGTDTRALLAYLLGV